jgi:ribonuclease HI
MKAELLRQARKVDIYFDGSAVDGPPHILGAGWIRVVNGVEVDPYCLERINAEPPTTNRSLFAELVSATKALQSVPPGKVITMYGDHGHVIDFINTQKLAKKIRVGEPVLASYFGRLEHAIQQHRRVTGVKNEHVKGVFDVAVHNLAAAAAGSHKVLSHPDLPKIFGGLLVRDVS